MFSAFGSYKEGDAAVIERIHPAAKISTRATPESAGADVYSVEEKLIPAGKQGRISLGLKLTSPVGTYARVAPRSGLAATKMIGVGAGVIDRDFVGECAVVCLIMGPSLSK